jgi:glycosyltransferase involved in cell wall biosynthesis
MKILFYNHTGQVGGGEGMLLLILARLDRDRFDPVVICPEQGPLQNMVDQLAVPTETVTSLEARFTWRPDHLLRYLRSFMHVISQIRKSVINIKPDLIHANSIRAGLVATAATVGLETRVVWHLHDLLPHHPLSTGIRLFAFFSSRTNMIAVSQAAAGRFRGAFLPWKDRVTVILNAIDPGKFQANETARQEIRAELELGKDEFVIGIVGRLTAGKGQLELLRAFAQVVNENPQARLVIVGSPQFNRDHPYSQLLKDTALKLGIDKHVRMTGERNDIPAIMHALDLLVINSAVEAFCLVILEAMVCGTPILAAVSGGIPELIEHRKNGWLLPRRDEETLAGAILELSRQPLICAQLAEQGKKHIDSRFCAERYMSELEVFYYSTSSLKSFTNKDAAAERVGGAPAGLNA